MHCSELNGLTDLGKNVVHDSEWPLGIFQWVPWASHNTGLSERGGSVQVIIADCALGKKLAPEKPLSGSSG